MGDKKPKRLGDLEQEFEDSEIAAALKTNPDETRRIISNLDDDGCQKMAPSQYMLDMDCKETVDKLRAVCRRYHEVITDMFGDKATMLEIITARGKTLQKMQEEDEHIAEVCKSLAETDAKFHMIIAEGVQHIIGHMVWQYESGRLDDPIDDFNDGHAKSKIESSVGLVGTLYARDLVEVTQAVEHAAMTTAQKFPEGSDERNEAGAMGMMMSHIAAYGFDAIGEARDAILTEFGVHVDAPQE